MKIVSVATSRELDRRTIVEAGVPGELLMERAGEGAADHILAFAAALNPNHAQRFVILAGKGNNGGDAYVVARHLRQRSDRPVKFFAVCPIDALTGDARTHAQRLPADIAVEVRETLRENDFRPGDLIVDGLLGTGTHGGPRPPLDVWIRTVNASGCPVAALDIPSGLDGDTGEAPGETIVADLTIMMGLPKQGAFAGEGPARCGLLRVVDIGLPPDYIASLVSPTPALFPEDVRPAFSRVPMNSHKNSVGTVTVFGGSKDYGGAPFLSAKAAARSGAGLVTVAIPVGAAPVVPDCLALIVRRLSGSRNGTFSERSIKPALELAERANALVIGPGMTRDKACRDFLTALIALDKPMVLDADALNLLAETPSLATKFPRAVLTPHPGEATRLMKASGLESCLSTDRNAQARALAERFGSTVVLKGHRSVIATSEGRETFVNATGGPALATAGSGDVLSGVIAAYLATGMAPLEAAKTGVVVHGLTGELGPYGVRGLIADDIVDLLPAAARTISPFA